MRWTLIVAVLAGLAPGAVGDELLFSDGNSFWILDLSTQQLVEAPFEHPPEVVRSMAICPLGPVLVGGNGALYKINLETMEVQQALPGLGQIRGLACAPGGVAYVILGGGLWRFSPFNIHAEMELIGPVGTSSAYSLALSPDGEFFAFNVNYDTLHFGLNVLDPEKGETTHVGEPVGLGSADPPLWLDFDACGRLFGGGNTGELFEFDLESGAMTRVEFGPSIAAGAFLPVVRIEDLGGGSAGEQGIPLLTVEGSLQPNTETEVALASAAGSAMTILFVGSERIDGPLFGGTLVPAPDVVFAGLVTDARGELAFTLRWPKDVPCGTEGWWQAWVQDGGATQGWAASNSVKTRAP